MTAPAPSTPNGVTETPPQSDERLLTLAFQSGDTGAYGVIYERYSRRVRALCRRMLVNPDDAAEASQETFLRVYQGLGRFNGRYQLNAWIMRIATNVCLDQLRSRGRRGRDVMAFEMSDLDTPCDTSELPEEVAVRQSESRRVRRVLESLPPMHRAAIALRDFEGLSYQEVAEALEITEPQVKALIHRARQRFKRDWTSVAALWPWRMVQKLRGGENVARESVVYGPAGQLAPACSNAVQQCGHYVMEKLTPVFAAALVTTTAAAPMLPVVRHAVADETSVQRVATDETDPSRGPTRHTRAATEPDKAVSTEVGPEIGRSATPPAEEPAPTPTTTPAPGTPPSENPDGSSGSETGGSVGGSIGGPTASPTASPTPAGPFTPVIGFDWGRSMTGRTPDTHEFYAECGTLSVEQRAETAIEDDDSPAWHDALFTMDGGLQIAITLTVEKSGSTIFYDGRSISSETWREGELLQLRYSGTYQTRSSEARNVDLPQGGSFDVALGVDCATHSVVTESVVFHI